MRSQVELAIRLSIAWVFLASAVSKLVRPVDFARVAVDYGVFAPRLSFIAALGLIPLELLLGASHLTGWAIGLAAPGGCALLTLFGIVLLKQLQSGRVLPCYCFGANSSAVVSYRSLSRVILMIVGEGLVWRGVRGPKGFVSQFAVIDGPDGLLSVLGLATVLSVLSVWTLQVDELLCLLPREWMALTPKFMRKSCEGEEL